MIKQIRFFLILSHVANSDIPVTIQLICPPTSIFFCVHCASPARGSCRFPVSLFAGGHLRNYGICHPQYTHIALCIPYPSSRHILCYRIVSLCITRFFASVFSSKKHPSLSAWFRLQERQRLYNCRTYADIGKRYKTDDVLSRLCVLLPCSLCCDIISQSQYNTAFSKLSVKKFHKSSRWKVINILHSFGIVQKHKMHLLRNHSRPKYHGRQPF